MSYSKRQRKSVSNYTQVLKQGSRVAMLKKMNYILRMGGMRTHALRRGNQTIIEVL